MRTLYYVPMVHTSEETNGKALRDIFKSAKISDLKIDEFLRDMNRMIAPYWEITKEVINKKIKDPEGLFVYLESVWEGEEQETAEAILNKKPAYESPALDLVRNLLEKGAILKDTESGKSYKRHGNFLNLTEIIYGKMSFILEKIGFRKIADLCDSYLIASRDKFIARKINETLPDNTDGILFIGADHRVDKQLRKLEKNKKLLFPLKITHLITEEEVERLETKIDEIFPETKSK